MFTRYFARLVAGNASQIFPALARPGGNAGNHHLLVAEMRKISHDSDQARRIAESIETGTEDIFRDFDLSSFMEHFKLDALEKTILALAFKLGTRSDLKTKGMFLRHFEFSCSLLRGLHANDCFQPMPSCRPTSLPLSISSRGLRAIMRIWIRPSSPS